MCPKLHMPPHLFELSWLIWNFQKKKKKTNLPLLNLSALPQVKISNWFCFCWAWRFSSCRGGERNGGGHSGITPQWESEGNFNGGAFLEPVYPLWGEEKAVRCLLYASARVYSPFIWCWLNQAILNFKRSIIGKSALNCLLFWVCLANHLGRRTVSLQLIKHLAHNWWVTCHKLKKYLQNIIKACLLPSSI